MYILGISGSPRRGGNTEILLDKALLGAKEKGAETEKVILNALKMCPCQECDTVKDDGTCKIEDDFQALYEKIRNADAIILASPIFFGSLSAQTKIMIDRFQCLWGYKYVLQRTKDEGRRTRDEGRKQGVFLCAEASMRKDFFDNAKSIIKNLFATIDVNYKEELLCSGVDKKGIVKEHEDCLNEAFEIGKRLC